MGSCEHWEEALSALLDGELDGAERREAEKHLADCAACRAVLADLTAIHEAMEAVPAPEGFARSVMERVERTPQAGGRKIIPWRRWGALAACCALALLGLWRLQAGDDTGSGGTALPAAAFRSAVTAEEDAPEEDAALPEAQSEEPPEPCGYMEKAAPAAEEPKEEGGTESAVLSGLPNISVVVHGPEEAVSPGEDYEGVVYEGETFLLRTEEAGLTVFWFPQGEDGPCCEAQAGPETSQSEVFDLLLSLDISSVS